MFLHPGEDRFDEVHQGGSFSDEEREFLQAIENYQSSTGRRFLSWHEVLRVIKALGYRKDVNEAAGA